HRRAPRHRGTGRSRGPAAPPRAVGRGLLRPPGHRPCRVRRRRQPRRPADRYRPRGHMTGLPRDSVAVSADPAAVWAVIDDPTALARVLPGAESLEPVGPGRWRGVLASKIGFMTVRAHVTASLHDADPPTHLRLELEGRPRGLAG